MQTDAIHGDVSEQEGGQQPVLSDRERAMQEIDAQIAASLPAAEPEQSKSVADDVLPETLADDQLERVRVRVKVDGQVVELPLSEVTKGYQKDAVASRRLAIAAEERKKLDAERALFEQAKQQSAAPSQGTDDAGDVDAQIKAAMAALVEGDEDAAAAALKSMLKGRQATTPQIIDEDAVVHKAAALVVQQQGEEARAKDWQEFVAANPVFADQTSKQRQYGDYLFNTVYAPKIEAGEISYREALNSAAADASTVFRPEPMSSRQQKEERKRAIDNLPVAGARAARSQPVDETMDDVLAEMRRSRGQPV